MSQIISQEGLRALVGEWMARGNEAAGPAQIKPGLVQYAQLNSPAELLLDGFIHPANSIKEFFFPRHEELYRYRVTGNKVELTDRVDDAVKPMLIVGARPCDAAILPALDRMFNWDYRDEFYNKRRKATTVVTIACKRWDDECFCTSVGLGPAAEQGSDVMLLDLGNGSFEARCLTDAGRTLLNGKTQESDRPAAQPAEGPARRFDSELVADFVRSNFNSPLWGEQTLRCAGCGACAYTCPTCHCFDIVDEGGGSGGRRARNWDSCQFTMFTLHASGHNPRSNQGQRQRQRLFHKFVMYPEKFGHILCTGCGNCGRNCPVSLGLLKVLEAIEHNAAATVSEEKNG